MYPTIVKVTAAEIDKNIVFRAELSSGQILLIETDLYEEKIEDIYSIEEDFTYIYNRLISDEIIVLQNGKMVSPSDDDIFNIFDNVKIDEKAFEKYQVQSHLKAEIKEHEKEDILLSSMKNLCIKNKSENMEC